MKVSYQMTYSILSWNIIHCEISQTPWTQYLHLLNCWGVGKKLQSILVLENLKMKKR